MAIDAFYARYTHVCSSFRSLCRAKNRKIHFDKNNDNDNDNEDENVTKKEEERTYSGHIIIIKSRGNMLRGTETANNRKLRLRTK